MSLLCFLGLVVGIGMIDCVDCLGWFDCIGYAWMASLGSLDLVALHWFAMIGFDSSVSIGLAWAEHINPTQPNLSKATNQYKPTQSNPIP